jgi:ribose transport system ATP-binding protein
MTEQTSTPALQLAGVSKAFNGKVVLHPFELSIQPGEIHVLLGQNGSGKSTLIKILAGYHLPEPGASIAVAGEGMTFGDPDSSHRLGVRFVHQDLGLIEDASITDNFGMVHGYPTVLGRIDRRKARRIVREKLAACDIDLNPEILIRDVSAAIRTKVAIARALDVGGRRANLLVLDEPTATLPLADVEQLHALLRAAARSGVAILYVTHHLNEVNQIGTFAQILRDGRLVYSERIAKADHDTLVSKLIGADLQAVAKSVAANAPATRNAPVVLRVRDLRSDSLAGVDFDVREGEVLGIYGLIGSGCESILGSIFGALPRSGGAVQVGDRLLPSERPDLSAKAGVGYVPPDRHRQGAFMHLTAAENVTIADLSPFWSQAIFHRRRERRSVNTLLEGLEVRPERSAHLPLASFSGGNQQKLVLGRWLRTSPKLLLLDEPTQGVDVGAKAGLHRQILGIRDQGTAAVISSTDEDELVTLCDRVIILNHGVKAAELVGDEISAQEITRRFHAVGRAEMTHEEPIGSTQS